MNQMPAWMTRLVKIVLFVVLFYTLLVLAIMIGSGDTGPWERAILAVVAIGVYALAVPIHRIGGKRL